MFVTYPGNPILRKTKLSIKDAISNQSISSTRDIGYSAILEDALYRQGIELDPVMDIGSVYMIYCGIRTIKEFN